MDEKQPIKTRKMKDTKSDIDDVLDIERKAFKQYAWRKCESFRCRIKANHAFVACKGGEVVGYLLLKSECSGWLLEKMAVKYESQGIGTALVNWAKCHVGSERTTLIRLNVRGQNTRARRLYQKTGFVETGRLGTYTNGDTKIEMTWKSDTMPTKACDA